MHSALTPFFSSPSCPVRLAAAQLVRDQQRDGAHEKSGDHAQKVEAALRRRPRRGGGARPGRAVGRPRVRVGAPAAESPAAAAGAAPAAGQEGRYCSSLPVVSPMMKRSRRRGAAWQQQPRTTTTGAGRPLPPPTTTTARATRAPPQRRLRPHCRRQLVRQQQCHPLRHFPRLPPPPPVTTSLLGLGLRRLRRRRRTRSRPPSLSKRPPPSRRRRRPPPLPSPLGPTRAQSSAQGAAGAATTHTGGRRGRRGRPPRAALCPCRHRKACRPSGGSDARARAVPRPSSPARPARRQPWWEKRPRAP